jgi:hypothetical protein
MRLPGELDQDDPTHHQYNASYLYQHQRLTEK